MFNVIYCGADRDLFDWQSLISKTKWGEIISQPEPRNKKKFDLFYLFFLLPKSWRLCYNIVTPKEREVIMNKLFVIERCNNAETGAMEFTAAFADESLAKDWAKSQSLQGKFAGSNGKWRTDYYECYEMSTSEFALNYFCQ